MSWTTLDFGKHKGKTIPQVMFSDPDWFFWAIEENAFDKRPNIRAEAYDLDKKARNIKIPKSCNDPSEVRYFIHQPSGKFSHFEIVPIDQPLHEGSSPELRCDVIDMSIPRQISAYDKLGCKELVRSLKHHVFGESSVRITKRKCESFFSNESNFA